MNVAIIPSWYPNSFNPISGIFFKEQAIDLARMYPSDNFVVINWGQSDPNLNLNIREINKARHLHSYLRKNKPRIEILLDNLIEIYIPIPTWSHKILHGNVNSVIKASIQAIQLFENRFGKIDLLHAHVSFPAGYVAMKISEKYRKPYLITEHMGPFPFPQFLKKNGGLKEIIYEPLSKANTVITVSPSLQNLLKTYNIFKSKYIPNVIDEDFFKPEIIEASSKFRFFTLAHLCKEKGIDDLLHSIKKVIAQNPNVLFRIGGGGQQIAYYKKISSELNIQDNITWLGPLSREEAKLEYNNCDAFVLPSYFETFGVVYAEAIACGKPVIATRCGGPNEIINNINGLLVDIGDIESIVEAILQLMKEYNKYSSNEIRQDFLNRFSKAEVLPKIMKTYEEIICAGLVE